MSRKIVLLLVAIVLFLTACGTKTNCQSTGANNQANQPTVKDSIGDLPMLPTGTYPVSEIQINERGSSYLWAAVVLADPTKSGNFRYYRVSPEILTVQYSANCAAGYAEVSYETVTIHLPPATCP